MAMGRRFNREPRGPQIRINHRIRVPEVRVLDADGSNLGVIETGAALKRAAEQGLDLVEVNPKTSPPVCKILDFGKYKYEEKKKQREAKRKQTVVEVKEVKLRPKTDDHDLNVKMRAARKFIENGNKVKVTCRFRGREITHPQIAQRQLAFFVENTGDIANVEQSAAMEGRTMALLLAPKAAVMQKISNERAEREKDTSRPDHSRPDHSAPQNEAPEEESA
ncbi:MAG TPA: translation initiation factor IF-3 [Polyangiaceae bacterium]|nr:translation initiation factor IF-3 [Polyangiaceae bacterium]